MGSHVMPYFTRLNLSGICEGNSLDIVTRVKHSLLNYAIAFGKGSNPAFTEFDDSLFTHKRFGGSVMDISAAPIKGADEPEPEVSAV